MLSDTDIQALRKHVKEGDRPLFFVDGDVDGVCSYVTLDEYADNDTYVVLVRDGPSLGKRYMNRVIEFRPDTIFVLDKPYVTKEFLDSTDTDVVWIDHHDIQDVRNAEYYNPRIYDEASDVPVSRLAYEIGEDTTLWKALVGMVGDWYFEKDLVDEVKESYPSLFSGELEEAPDVTYGTEFGAIVDILNFNLKRRTSEAIKAVKMFSRIDDPETLLAASSKEASYLMEYYEKVNKRYQAILENIYVDDDDDFIVHRFGGKKGSFSSDLANELFYENPDKTVVICREVKDRIIMSVRSSNNIRDVFKQSLQPFEAQGGGHENACGGSIKMKDFRDFITMFKRQVSSKYI